MQRLQRTQRYQPDPIDLAFALILAGIMVSIIATSHAGSWRLVAALAATLPLAYRRRWPLAVYGVALLGVIGAATQEAFWPDMAAIMTATYSMGAYGRNRLFSVAVLLLSGSGILLTFGGKLPPIPEFTTPYLILLTPWLVGIAIRDRQTRLEAVQDRAVRLEQEQERAAHLARAEERERIARELHDVVAHGVSIMVIQAGAARHVLRTSPEQATDALLVVESTGREAMSDLRNMLGVLNQEGEVDLAPQPGISQIPSLVKRVEEAGLPVELHIGGQERPLTAGLNLAAYRIVQEALTNALKYSGLAHTAVSLEYRANELKIEVVNEGRSKGTDDGASTAINKGGVAGRGLAGMRERVALYGGTVEAGPRLLGQGYVVRAWLPLGGVPLDDSELRA